MCIFCNSKLLLLFGRFKILVIKSNSCVQACYWNDRYAYSYQCNNVAMNVWGKLNDLKIVAHCKKSIHTRIFFVMAYNKCVVAIRYTKRILVG